METWERCDMCARPANPELKAEIVKAATRIVEGCGPDCVTMREVAEEVGYSPTTLYLYFRDKHDILREVIVEGFDDFSEFASMSEVGPSALDRFRQRARAHIVWGLMHPGLYRLMFETPVEADWDPEETKRIDRGTDDSVRVLREAVRDGLLPKKTDALSVALGIWAAVHGVASLAISRRLFGGSGADDAAGAGYLKKVAALSDGMVNNLLASHEK